MALCLNILCPPLLWFQYIAHQHLPLCDEGQRLNIYIYSYHSQMLEAVLTSRNTYTTNNSNTELKAKSQSKRGCELHCLVLADQNGAQFPFR